MLVFPVFLIQCLFVVGLIFLLAPMNVFYRDIGFIIPVAVQLLMFATPIIYPLSIVPAHFRPYYILNPLAGIIDGLSQNPAPQRHARLALVDRCRRHLHRVFSLRPALFQARRVPVGGCAVGVGGMGLQVTGIGSRVAGQHLKPENRSSMNARPKIESWKDLEVWKLSHALVLQVYKITKNFPADERFRLTDQLTRSAASVPTNIAEGKGRNALKEYLYFLSIAKGSVEETKYLLLLSKDLGYVSPALFAELSDGYDQVSKMLTGLARSRGFISHPAPRTRHL